MMSSCLGNNGELFYVDGEDVVLKLGGNVMSGKGFISSFNWSMDRQDISFTNHYGSETVFGMGDGHMPRTRRKITLEIELYDATTISNTGNSLAEVLTNQFSEVQLMKEINRRWNQQNKENNHV